MTAEQAQLNEASIWKNSIFMKIFASYSVSVMGHWFDITAVLVLFGYVWQTDPMMIALIPVAYALPQTIFGQFAGVIADRFHKIKLMMTADLITVALTLILFFTGSPWLALVLLSLRSAVNAIHVPAQQGVIKQIVDKNLIVKAVTMNGTVNQAAKIVSPVLGGVIIGVASPKLCILINAIAFFISACILLRILKDENMRHRTARIETAKENDKTFWASWRHGWSVVFRSRILLFSILTTFLGLTAIQMVDIQIPVLFREIAADSPQLVSWVMGASGLGAAAMILFLNRFKKLDKFGWLLGSGVLLIGVGFGGMGLLQEGFQTIVPLVLAVSTGLGVGLIIITSQYIIQTESNEDEVGRVSGISNSLLNLTVLVSPIVGGWLVQLFNVSVIYQASGLALCAIGFLAAALNAVLFKEKQSETTLANDIEAVESSG